MTRRPCKCGHGWGQHQPGPKCNALVNGGGLCMCRTYRPPSRVWAALTHLIARKDGDHDR